MLPYLIEFFVHIPTYNIIKQLRNLWLNKSLGLGDVVATFAGVLLQVVATVVAFFRITSLGTRDKYS